MSFQPFRSLRDAVSYGCTAALATALMSSAAMAAPKVVATIKPVHSIVAAVMDGVGEPDILIDGAASPHTFALKPSQASKLQAADVVFWIGEGLETSLAKPMSSLPSSAEVVELSETPGLELLPFRELSEFGDHGHDDHDHGHEAHDGHDDHKDHADGQDDHAHAEDHDKHDHAAHDETGHDEAGHDEAGHEGEHAHSGAHEHEDDHAHEHESEHADAHEHAGHAGHDHHGAFDPHIWLDPANASVLATAVADVLAKADPENAETYKANAATFHGHLKKLTAEINNQLASVRGRPFVVFHDAYHYFENRFDIPATGAISINPETPSSAERVRDIRETVKDEGVVCVFAEPQFEPKLIKVVTEGTSIKSGTLDPLGADLANGPALYEQLIKGLADSMSACLASGA